MQKDFITATPDSGSGDGNVTVQASQNTGGERSSSITITGGGITRTIAISQEATPFNVIIVGDAGNIIKTLV